MYEHGEAIEADLLRYYQLDLPAALGTVGLTWRRLDLLLAALPADAATNQARYGDAVAWSTSDHLLAAVADRVEYLTYVTRQHRSKTRLQLPKPIPRPGRRDEGRIGAGKGMSIEQLRAKLARPRQPKGGDSVR